MRSVSGENAQVRCTFERPNVFLRDPSDPTKGKGRIHKIVDMNDCSNSQIIVRGRNNDI